MKKFKLGIALGGGGARGIAGLGVLKVLEENNLKPDIIVGCSMGSIVGAMYVIEGSVEGVKKKFRELLFSDTFKKLKTEKILSKDKKAKEIKNAKSIRDRMEEIIWKAYIAAISSNRLSLLDEESIKDVINTLVSDVDIKDLNKPYAAVAVDIQNADPKTIIQGSLRDAVRASSAIPGIFPPVKIDGNFCSDGCALGSVPIRQTFELGADYVIAVDVRSNKVRSRGFKNLFEVVTRNNEISNGLLTNEHLKEADIALAPDIRHFHWADFKKLDRISKEGENSARENLENIITSIKKKKKSTIIKRLFSKS